MLSVIDRPDRNVIKSNKTIVKVSHCPIESTLTGIKHNYETILKVHYVTCLQACKQTKTEVLIQEIVACRSFLT